MDRMISGIKPTGALTLGNYIGAIKEFVKYQDEYDLFVFIADLHALTVYNNPEKLRENTNNLIATYLAAGLNPQKVNIFKQSDIAAHNQLEWVLTCNTKLNDLFCMPQYLAYKESRGKDEAPISGMLLYPSLMNSDILLYDAKYVPVGEDQRPHVNLTRDVADAFNKRYGETFVLPQALLAKQGAKIMSLSDPTKKMSKSESDKGTIYLLDDEETIRRKLKKATADGEGKIYYNPETKPGISNLLVIMSSLSGKSISDLEDYYKDKPDYGKFKSDVADVVWTELSKLQTKIKEIKNSNLVETVLESGFCNAVAIANDKIEEVYKKIGLR